MGNKISLLLAQASACALRTQRLLKEAQADACASGSILLRKGVHAELQEILAEIMEQAEARYKEWEFEAA